MTDLPFKSGISTQALVAGLQNSEVHVWWQRAEARDRVTPRQTSSEFVRAVLARYVERQELALVRDCQGKPSLAGVDWLRFNLSHSGEWLAVALSFQSDLGLDLERMRRFSDRELFVERCCTPIEACFVREHSGAERERALLSLWTLKEAYSKAIGTGIRGPMREIDTRHAPAGAGWMISCAWASGAPCSWYGTGIWAPDGYVASLCCSKLAPNIRHFSHDAECPFPEVRE